MWQYTNKWADKKIGAVRCTLALTESHDTVSRSWRKTKWNEKKDFKSSMIFTKLHVYLKNFLFGNRSETGSHFVSTQIITSEPANQLARTVLFTCVVCRGYYMAVRRNGYYLRVLIISLTSERCFQHKKIKSVSQSGHVIFFLLYEIFTVKRN